MVSGLQYERLSGVMVSGVQYERLNSVMVWCVVREAEWCNGVVCSTIG